MIFQSQRGRAGPPISLVFKGGGGQLLFLVFKDGFHSQIRYFYPILAKFSDEEVCLPSGSTNAEDEFEK
jgi:hypothetical protein